jgi:hypothetical protein
VPGPPPKRSSQRRRMNKVDIDQVEMAGTVEAPDLLDLEDAHPLAVNLYESLKASGQARWYEPSDWARAQLLVWSLSKMLNTGRPSAMLLAALQKDMDALLVSEAERRRVRMEIERGAPDDSAERAKVAQMEAYRRAAGGS